VLQLLSGSTLLRGLTDSDNAAALNPGYGAATNRFAVDRVESRISRCSIRATAPACYSNSSTLKKWPYNRLPLG
jgi:hypothetical protein